ncbi:MAG: 16S rRNA (adenine(1518)-N(6)/adenine(1519)-N(6))-dimethyltransferase RsmA [Isosphaeraceae bacterium]|nr:16S rRNA (adenine(1518)-N(6)/adenine(1519)-N(6))-dimethyltransferase RsmA [Isosphaeraceae bacterium]
MARQTQNYLRELFSRKGIAPRHRFGQNFLIDLNLHEVIVKAAEVGPGDVILEVGPGAGALTTLMAERGAAVVAVDIDPMMVQLTTEATLGMPNVRVIHADALESKNRLDPFVLDQIRAGLAVEGEHRFKLTANLPYNVATPIITNLLVHPDPVLRPERLVVTIQLELAERMTAAPQSENYSSLSVLIQALTDVEVVRVLPPSVFWPRPKVDSAVIKITPNAEKKAAIGDLPWFHSVVRRVFLHRRKHLRGVLHTMSEGKLSKVETDALLGDLGLDGSLRAETMNVEEWISLADALRPILDPVADTDGA